MSKLSEDHRKRSSSEMEHFFSQIQVQTKKKDLHQKWNTFFLRIEVQICAQIHTRVKLLEGMQMKTILKLLGGIQSNYWEDTSSPGFGTPGHHSGKISVMCLFQGYNNALPVRESNWESVTFFDHRHSTD